MMKSGKIYIIALFLVLSISVATDARAATGALPEVKGTAAFLVEAERGQVLYRKYPDVRVPVSIASKLMTVVLALEKVKPDENVTISKESAIVDGSLLNMEGGEKHTVEDLLGAVMLTATNDAAIAIAEYVGGDVKKFTDLMNNKAKDLNMKNTRFTNPTGIYDENQYTTASDLSLLIRYGISNPLFKSLLSYKALSWDVPNKTQILINTNKMFWMYDGVDGGKSGITWKNNQSAVTTATRNGMKLISIVLDSPGDDVFNDTVNLLDYGYDNFRQNLLVQKNQALKTVTIQDQEIDLLSRDDILYVHPLGDNNISNIEYVLTKEPTGPIQRSNILGMAKFTLKDGTVVDVNLYPDRDIRPPSNIINLLMGKLNENKDVSVLLVLMLLLEVSLIGMWAVRAIRNR